YTIVPHGSGAKSVTVTIAAGQARQIRFRDSSTGGMDYFPEDQWSKQNGWYVHRGGQVLYNSTSGLGTYLFVLKLHFSHSLFSHPSRIRWVLGYIDANNYTKMEMDNKFVYRIDVVNGEKHEWLKQAHHIAEDTQWM